METRESDVEVATEAAAPPGAEPPGAAPSKLDMLETGPYVDGFSRRTVLGAVFVALVMMPGSIYLGLVAGQSLGPAAEWVTIILFAEVARRSFASLKRQEVYITNVIKCRPPGNRDPLPEEVEACKSYLDRQIELIQPKLVVTLGRFSMARAFPKARISRIHGQPCKIGGVIYYPMYPPAAALHQPSLRRTVEEDMQRIPELIRQAAQIAESAPPVEAEQLKLF